MKLRPEKAKAPRLAGHRRFLVMTPAVEAAINSNSELLRRDRIWLITV